MFSLHDILSMYRRNREKTNSDLNTDRHSLTRMSISVTRVCPLDHEALFSMRTLTGMRVAERCRLRSSVAPPTVILWGQQSFVLRQARDSSAIIVERICAVANADSGDSFFPSLKQTVRSRVNSDQVHIVSRLASFSSQAGRLRHVVGTHPRNINPEGAKVFCFLSA